jgi:hypothetical protein
MFTLRPQLDVRSVGATNCHTASYAHHAKSSKCLVAKNIFNVPNMSAALGHPSSCTHFEVKSCQNKCVNLFGATKFLHTKTRLDRKCL